MRKGIEITVIMSGGDTVAPTVAITSTATSPGAILPVPIVFTLSEASTDFAVGDLTLGGCTVANFAGSGTSYTCEATPTTQNGTFTIDIAENAFHDAAGNGNTAATQFSFTSNAFLLVDKFTTTEAAPMASPRTCEPLGTLTLAQVDGELSIVGGAMSVPVQASPAYGDLGAYDATARTRKCGLALIGDYKRTNGNAEALYNCWQGVARVATGFGDVKHGFYGTTAVRNAVGGVGVYGETINIPNQLLTILRAAGAFYIANGGAYTQPTLLYLDSADTTSPLYAGVVSSANIPMGIDNVEVVDLSACAGWGTDDGIATQVLSGARNAGDNFTHTPDFLAEFTVTTLPSADSIDIRFRIQDANNYWQVLISSAGAITVNEVVNGTPAQRATGTGVVNGKRIVVIIRGTLLYVVSGDSLKASYAFVSTFTTQTAGQLASLGTGGAVTSIKTFPAYPTLPAGVVHPFDGSPTGLFTFLPVGDSKAAQWPTNLQNYAAPNVTFKTGATTLAVGGQTVAQLVTNIDTNLPAMTNRCDGILWNMGTNDAHSGVFPGLVEATWKANVLYCWDALNAKYPGIQIYMMYIWRRAFPDNCDVIDGWFADILPLRSFVEVIADERVWLENEDDGATYTSDGTHYSVAGNQLAADLWRAGCGY